MGAAAAQLAHEIKNPLGSIRLGVEMLRQYTTSDEGEKTISLVERGIHHLNKLVVDVTQFSRHRHLDLADTDLRDVINSSIELVMDRVHEKETPLTIDFHAAPIHCKCISPTFSRLQPTWLEFAESACHAVSPSWTDTVCRSVCSC